MYAIVKRSTAEDDIYIYAIVKRSTAEDDIYMYDIVKRSTADDNIYMYDIVKRSTADDDIYIYNIVKRFTGVITIYLYTWDNKTACKWIQAKGDDALNRNTLEKGDYTMEQDYIVKRRNNKLPVLEQVHRTLSG